MDRSSARVVEQKEGNFAAFSSYQEENLKGRQNWKPEALPGFTLDLVETESGSFEGSAKEIKRRKLGRKEKLQTPLDSESLRVQDMQEEWNFAS